MINAESPLELFLRRIITVYILRTKMQGYLGSRFINELAVEIAAALREDAKALKKKRAD